MLLKVEYKPRVPYSYHNFSLILFCPLPFAFTSSPLPLNPPTFPSLILTLSYLDSIHCLVIGMTGGVVGRGSCISDPKEKQHEQDLQTPSSNQCRSPFTFRQLTAVATATLLAAAGMVGVEDIAFVVLSFIYMYFLSRVAFPRLSPSMESPVFGRNNKVLRNYVLIAALIGLFLPIAYIIEGIFDDDKEGIKAAAPHLFLLSGQVFMEGVSASNKFSLPIKVFVPVFYNSRRIFTIVDWMRAEISKADELQSQSGSRRSYVGRWLAIANMTLWCFNLFGFLVPFYLPKAFKTYYSGYKVNDKI